MKKRKGLIIGVIITVFLFEVLTGYISKLLLAVLTGVGDSDDLDIMMGLSREYNLTVIQTATAYNNLPLVFNNEVFSAGVQEREQEIVNLAAAGKTADEICTYAQQQLQALKSDSEKIKKLTDAGYSPIEIYVMSDNRLDTIYDY